ncbi:trichodiene synthase [Colletotrichum tamarilloi]|uniref:Trichodiene synthase n=1 Tax=Colletotrichum tamarilloi TaxID=1209934 RepID=A0ABQ9R273_9PEZI|nr:trichodiene synthase [Colletotrichum tamarilloi]KAK1492451.1 trichodiene synthase [Colletotrichum tamarilloi]
MDTASFPTDCYLDAVVSFLSIINYNDTNYTHQERVRNLHYAYAKAAKHFAQPTQQRLIKASPRRLQASLQTIVAMVVYAWVRVDPEVMADLSIHYTYMLVLDDSQDDPDATMQSFYQDLLAGKPQRHPWWQMVNAQFPTVLSHYGPYCGLNLVRSTTDCKEPWNAHNSHVPAQEAKRSTIFQGCWIEQHNFQGFPGSYDFPGFLRRMNGLGHCVGASIFPKAQFDEKVLFTEITSVISQMENWMVFVNDLLSFYKEFDEPRDQTSLVNNYAKCDRITLAEALNKLTRDTIRCSEQIVEVFADKDPSIADTLQTFCQGYVTWHLSDPRYRLRELVTSAAGGDTATAKEFRRYQAAGDLVGAVDPKEWAYPPVADLVEDHSVEEVVQVATPLVPKTSINASNTVGAVSKWAKKFWPQEYI